MANRTPAEIAADKIETQKILREKGYFHQVARDNANAKAAQLAADAESGRLAEQATAVAQARHAAAMADYNSGSALDRAIAGYKVKRSVADFAMAEGRRSNGETLPVVAAIVPSVGLVKAPIGDSAETPAQ